MTEYTIQMNETKPLPDGWRWVKLGDVSEEIYRYPTYYNIEYTEQGIPEVRGELIREDGTLETDSTKYRFISKRTSDRYSRTILKEGDFVLSVRGSMGKVALIPSGFSGANMTANLIRISPIRGLVYSPFLKFVFLSEYFRTALENLSPQTTIRTIRAPMLKSILIPLPPLPEQKRIAGKIQELMAAVERARTACEAQLEAAKALPKAYLREVFESEEAKKWERRRLGEVVRTDAIPLLANAPEAQQLPYVGLEQVESETGKITITLQGGKNASVESTTFRFDSRHILYGKLRPYLNKVALPDFEGRCSTELLPLLPAPSCDRHYLAWFLRRSQTVAEAMRYMTGTRMPRIDIDELFKLAIPLPSLPEQKRIAAELGEKIGSAEKLKATIEKQLEAIKALPQAILRKAFSGEL